MSKKQVTLLTREQLVSLPKKEAKKLADRIPPEPKENPKVEATRHSLKEESLENLFSFLHVQK